jgi:hypothetical protein
MEKISKMENNFKNANYWHIIDAYKLQRNGNRQRLFYGEFRDFNSFQTKREKVLPRWL